MAMWLQAIRLFAAEIFLQHLQVLHHHILYLLLPETVYCQIILLLHLLQHISGKAVTDSVNWTNFSGGTTANLAGTLIGALTQKTYFRRFINGDACPLPGASGVTINVDKVNVSGTPANVTCYGNNNGSLHSQLQGEEHLILINGAMVPLLKISQILLLVLTQLQ